MSDSDSKTVKFKSTFDLNIHSKSFVPKAQEPTSSQVPVAEPTKKKRRPRRHKCKAERQKREENKNEWHKDDLINSLNQFKDTARSHSRGTKKTKLTNQSRISRKDKKVRVKSAKRLSKPSRPLNKSQQKLSRSTHDLKKQVSEPPKKRTREEIYKDFKQKRKIKNIEVSEDIDVAFKELPKRLRTRITKKQMEFIKNNTTMGDIIGHLMDNNKKGIIKAPKEKNHKYVPGKNMAQEVNRMMNKNVNTKAGMSEAQIKQKKNEMLNYFVDRRKKKKPTAMKKAKQKVLDQQKEEEKEEEAEGEESEQEVDDAKPSEPKIPTDPLEKVTECITRGLQVDPCLEPSKQDMVVRDYVDHLVCKEINDKVKFIILKLKDFYIHRLKGPSKKTRTGRKVEAKKRYRFGLHEILKLAEVEEIKMVIISRNIMKVDEKGGFDEYVQKIISLCRAQKVPVVFAFTKYQLGMMSLRKGFSTSIVGVTDIHGVIPEVRELEEMVEEKRQEFYEITKPYHELMKPNPFLEHSRMTLDTNL